MSKINDNRSIDKDRTSSNILIISKSRLSSAKNRTNFLTIKEGGKKLTLKMKNGPLTKSDINQTLASMKKELAKNSKSYAKLDYDYRISTFLKKKNISTNPKEEEEKKEKVINNYNDNKKKFNYILSVETTRSCNALKSTESNRDNNENNNENSNKNNDNEIELKIKNIGLINVEENNYNTINNNENNKNNEKNDIENNDYTKEENKEDKDLKININLNDEFIAPNNLKMNTRNNQIQLISNNNTEEMNLKSSIKIIDDDKKKDKDNNDEKNISVSNKTISEKHSKIIFGSLIGQMVGDIHESSGVNDNNILINNEIDDKLKRNSIASKNDLISECKTSKFEENENEGKDDTDKKIINDNNKEIKIHNLKITNLIKDDDNKNNKDVENLEKIQKDFNEEEKSKKKRIIKSLYIKPSNFNNICKMCSICEHTFYITRMFVAECEKHYLCRKCAKNYYEDIIEKGQKDIFCPFFKCRELVDLTNLQKIISPEHFKRICQRDPKEENKNLNKLYFTKIKTNKDRKNIEKYTKRNVIDINSNKNFFNYHTEKEDYCPFCYEESLFTKTNTHFYKCLNCMAKICKHCFKEFYDNHINVNYVDHCKVYYRLNEKSDLNNNKFTFYLLQLFFVIASFFLCFGGSFFYIRKQFFYIFNANNNRNIIKYILGYFFTLICFIIIIPFIIILYPYFPSIMSLFDY